MVVVGCCLRMRAWRSPLRKTDRTVAMRLLAGGDEICGGEGR